jgi:hypothetical protein
MTHSPPVSREINNGVSGMTERTERDAWIWNTPRRGGEMERDMTLAATYSSNGLPREYHRRVGLNFRVRNGNGCFPDAMTTRVMSQMKTG